MRNLAVYRYIDATARTGSIRKAAEILSITPSALNRRIMALEDELGAPIFERHSRGVRLNTAGEHVVHAFRRHLAEAQSFKTFIADLKGLRRGHVSVVCSQALLPDFLPREIFAYRRSHPGVQFSVQIADGEEAEHALLTFSADLALVFAPLPLNDFETIATIKQPIHVLMTADHPLTTRSRLRLTDCIGYSLALPSRPYAVRNILDAAAHRMNISLDPVVESESYIFLRNFVGLGEAIGFDIKIGFEDVEGVGLTTRPLDLGPPSDRLLHLAQLRGRTLPVSASKFANDLAAKMMSFDG